MDLMITPIGLVSLAILLAMFLVATRKFVLGPLSLPAILGVTSVVYFYVVPVAAVERGESTFLGWTLKTLQPIHWAAALYAVGAAVAFWLFRSTLLGKPSSTWETFGHVNWRWFWTICATAVIGIFAQVMLGNLNLLYSQDYVIREQSAQFLNLSFSLLIPVVLVFLVYRNFDVVSVAALAVVLFVFLTVGFRFRIVILVASVSSAFLLKRGKKLSLPMAIFGLIITMISMNAIGAMRSYFHGLQWSALEGVSAIELLTHFSGEVGPVFTLSHLLDHPPEELILFDPWIVGVARLVPSFLWPAKPSPDYLLLYQAGYPDAAALVAGVAAPHHAELFLQFGWLGIPFLALVYYSIACASIRRSMKMGQVGAIVGCSMIPTLFGFYMLQRGYFFQTLCEYLFTFAPLLLMCRRGRTSRGKTAVMRPNLPGPYGSAPDVR